jgi:hypothetical protein
MPKKPIKKNSLVFCEKSGIDLKSLMIFSVKQES